jgi:hypothetical protein
MPCEDTTIEDKNGNEIIDGRLSLAGQCPARRLIRRTASDKRPTRLSLTAL